ncbi:MAG TPA: GNAT family N-acetyltransferase, partial [Polyangia bacterium]|nr:GNAT family N-acetyltransferase [Polyangia bacterium]
LWQVDWADAGDNLRVFEPTDGEIVAAAPALARAYGDAHNSRMMGQAPGAFEPADVIAHIQQVRGAGGHLFLLERDGALAGDADFRNLAAGQGEIAILIADTAAQGRGLGTRFAWMLHAFAFQVLHLQRLYAAVIPENRGSRRLFEKLGYTLDDSELARRYADEATDLTLSLGSAEFAAAWRAGTFAMRLAPR